VADWCREIRCIDPGADIRGRYASMEQGLALAGVKTLPMFFARLLRRAGLRQTRAARTGDVAVINISGLTCGAIVAAKGYVVLGEGIGLSRTGFAGARRIAAWSV
jgi:hypothetical protein